MRSEIKTGYFSGWENNNYWEVIDKRTGKPRYYSAKRRYKYGVKYILYIKKGKVVKTKVKRNNSMKRKELIRKLDDLIDMINTKLQTV